MRNVPTTPAPDGPLTVIPTRPGRCEPFAMAWCREIATSVAEALDTDVTSAGCRLTWHPDLPGPHVLHTAFTVAGHRVQVAAVWDNPWREPGFALTVDATPVPIDTSTAVPPAAALAHAAWRHIDGLDRAGVR
jgi:hypothetical protein